VQPALNPLNSARSQLKSYDPRRNLQTAMTGQVSKEDASHLPFQRENKTSSKLSRNSSKGILRIIKSPEERVSRYPDQEKTKLPLSKHMSAQKRALR